MGAVPLNAAKRSRGREARDVAGDAHDVGGHDGSNTEYVDGRGAGGGDDLGEALLRIGELAVDATKVVEELLGKLEAGGRHRGVRLDVGQQQSRFLGVDLLGNAAGDQLAQHGMQPAGVR